MIYGISLAKAIFHDGIQIYLVFQPVYKYFKTVADINKVIAWKSKGMSDESITRPLTSDYSLNPEIIYVYNAEILAKFHKNCFKARRSDFNS